ncbi:Uncharacterized protein dnm_066360 [Desulfonema magnum]|uniref:Uncharacterized protein n=1 Tax=Desulfonema magnum TaxID=45655 RepID=A0A975BS12_9BACT|nr:Uncharacterized protein dnm_066360 [Desulfonema magnum]
MPEQKFFIHLFFRGQQENPTFFVTDSRLFRKKGGVFYHYSARHIGNMSVNGGLNMLNMNKMRLCSNIAIGYVIMTLGNTK